LLRACTPIFAAYLQTSFDVPLPRPPLMGLPAGSKYVTHACAARRKSPGVSFLRWTLRFRRPGVGHDRDF
jgi:hypothetical protein